MAPGVTPTIRRSPALRGAIYKRVSTRKFLLYTIGLAYPCTLLASYWYSVKGSPSYKPFSFHSPHSKLDSSEYNALPNPIQANRENIIKEALNFYKMQPTKYTERIYDADVTFEDPLVFFKGSKTMACVIHGLPLICTKADVQNLEVSHYDQAISMKFDYTFEAGPLLSFEMPVLVYLTLDERNARIVDHKDMWQGRDFFDFFETSKPIKSINGYIARTVFGLPSGRFIE